MFERDRLPGGRTRSVRIWRWNLVLVAASESPRAGLSGNFGGAGAGPEGGASRLRGSSNGLTPECGESADTGEAESARSAFSPSTGDTITGDLFSLLELLPVANGVECWKTGGSSIIVDSIVRNCG